MREERYTQFVLEFGELLGYPRRGDMKPDGGR
jgi:hypothetical protein